jgi:hypothetical protein
MNHCLAQVFGVGLPSCLPKGDFVSRSIVLENQWMIHGDIRRPLFKVTYWIATRGHHITQELVRFRYGSRRSVNEARLDSLPGLYKACPVTCRERLDVQPLDSLCSFFECGFRMPPVAAFLYGALIFSSSELSAKSFSPALSVQEERGDARNENDA